MDIELSGKRVKCIRMFDEFPVPPGTEGTILYTDDINQIHVRWDDGKSLALVPEADDYRIANSDGGFDD